MKKIFEREYGDELANDVKEYVEKNVPSYSNGKVAVIVEIIKTDE